MPSQLLHSDYWRAEVLTMSDGQKSAAVSLEFTLTRRFLVPLDKDPEGWLGALRDLGLEDAAKLIRIAQHESPELRRFLKVDWTEAPEGQFSTDKLMRISSLANNRITWQIEGDPSPQGVLIGVVASGGYEVRIPITRTNMVATISRCEKLKEEAEKKMGEAKSAAEKSYWGTMAAVGAALVGAGAAAGGGPVGVAAGLIGAAAGIMSAYDAAVAAQQAQEAAAAAAAEAVGACGAGDNVAGGGDAVKGWRGGKNQQV